MAPPVPQRRARDLEFSGKRFVFTLEITNEVHFITDLINSSESREREREKKVELLSIEEEGASNGENVSPACWDRKNKRRYACFG